MNSVAHIANTISRLSGHALAWLVYAMMIASCIVVLCRYGFGISLIALQESVTYLHASVFMLGAAFTLQQGEHVRVDIFYRNYSAQRKALVDCVGTVLFLLPLCGFLLFSSFEFVANSWAIREASVEGDGLPAVFLLKTLIPLMAVLLIIQALAELVKNIQVLRND